MPRRNNRRDVYDPLDLTPDEIPTGPEPGLIDKAVRSHQREARERRERIERQENARINKGIDWSVCLVPGCGEGLSTFGVQVHRTPAWRDHTVALPLCVNHLAVAAKQAELHIHEGGLAYAAEIEQRRAAKREALREQAKAKHKARVDGHIYFVRLNGLVKVGWSRDVHARLRAYGPDVKVLSVYPGTRDDETLLHRQLRPVLARGREWYEDGPVVARFVQDALAAHGPPDVADTWTRPAPPRARRHGSARSKPTGLGL